MRKFNSPPTAKKNFIQGILCGIATLLCFVDIKSMYFLAILLALSSIANFWLFTRLKKREEEAKELQNKLTEGLEDEDEETEAARKRKKSKKEMRDEYNAFLQDLEEELGDFDEDEFDEDE